MPCMRLNKHIADTGFCSRREADDDAGAAAFSRMHYSSEYQDNAFSSDSCSA